MVTVAVPPLQAIGVVTDALVNESTGGCVTLTVPVTGPQLFTSVILYANPVPAGTPVKIPEVLVCPLKV